MGLLHSLSILLVLMNLIWVFKNTWYILLFFSISKTFITRREGGGTSALPMGSTLRSFQFICLGERKIGFQNYWHKTRFFTKTGHKFVFLCKNMLKFLYETRKKLKLFLMKTVKFHKTHWNCTQTVKFMQKLSELTKMTAIVICNSHQFHSDIKKCFSLYVWSE